MSNFPVLDYGLTSLISELTRFEEDLYIRNQTLDQALRERESSFFDSSRNPKLSEERRASYRASYEWMRKFRAFIAENGIMGVPEHLRDVRRKLASK